MLHSQVSSGAGRESWTPTPLRELAPKASAYTNSAIPANKYRIPFPIFFLNDFRRGWWFCQNQAKFGILLK